MGQSTMSSGSTFSNNISTAVDKLKAPTRETSAASKAGEKRETKWDTRHEVVFKNEEVSRLDRCYFDRWKEPEANLHAERTVRSLKPTWSLARDGSPEKTAEQLLANSGGRHTGYGAWNPRHERLFHNGQHTNMKSYFDRRREAEDMAASRQRKKVTNKDKLKIDWSLQDYGSKMEYHKTLRTESAPELSTVSKMRKTAPAWFSSHGVVF